MTTAPAVTIGQHSEAGRKARNDDSYGVVVPEPALLETKGIAMAIAGGALIYRGAAGHCSLYKALSVSTAKRKGLRASVKHGAGIKVEKSVTINKPLEELFGFWHDFENLPRFLNHLESVRAIGGRSGKLSHWIARLPAGCT